MVTLSALVVAIYAAVLIPFKLFPIIPGFTEARPGNALPVLFSFPFGPAAAWGAALGNGDRAAGTGGRSGKPLRPCHSDPRFESGAGSRSKASNGASDRGSGVRPVCEG